MSSNMTDGRIPGKLVKFAVPMILGNLFQLTYNAVDSIIVGRYAGEDALAAVGTANPIMNIIIFFIVGICLGASVLMSEYYGAGDLETLKKEISTTFLGGFFFTIGITIICLISTKHILLLIHTPIEIIDSAVQYLRIIFLGLLFTFLYHVCASALRSIGDSKTPIYFLILSSCVNAALDIVFVGWNNLGVIGAAYATVIAEAVSALLCVTYIYWKVPLIRLKRMEIVLDKTLLVLTIQYSWPSAMQQTVLYIGKVLVQSAVNPLGVEAIAAFNAVNRVDDFAFAPQQSIAQSMTVFIAQNRGAKKEERIQSGFLAGIVIEIAYCLSLLVVIYLGAPYVMQLFVTQKESEIVVLGTTYLRYMAFFYILPGFTNGIQGYFRGMGWMKVTFAATSVQMISRVIFAYLFISRFGFTSIAFACFGGWICMLTYEVPQYFRYRKRNKGRQVR